MVRACAPCGDDGQFCGFGDSLTGSRGPGDAATPGALVRPNATTRRRRFVRDLVSNATSALAALSEARAGLPLCLREGRPFKLFEGSAASLNASLRRRLSFVLPIPESVNREGALAALLKSHNTLTLDNRCTAVPYVEANVNIVKGETPVVDLLGVLPDSELKEMLSDPYRFIVRTDAELDATFGDAGEVYTDPALRDPAVMRRLIMALRKLGLVVFSKVARAKIGVFCVGKKDGKLRLVFDCRWANSLHRKPKKAHLASPGAFSNLRFDDETLLGGSQLPGAPDVDIHFGAIDLVDSFYQYQYKLLCSYFAFSAPMRARDISVSQVFDDVAQVYVPCQSDDFVYACLGTLPMGWSWSLVACNESLVDAMVCAERRLRGAQYDAERQFVQDRRPPPLLAYNRPLLGPYVDNANIVGWCLRDVAESLAALAAELTHRGFKFRVEEPGSQYMVAVGLRLCGPERTIASKPERV
jgi:hypothetical protein